MKSEDVRNTAFAMPLCSPSYPIGPYRFVDREYMIITYRTDRERRSYRSHSRSLNRRSNTSLSECLTVPALAATRGRHR
jgi:hypothetical protein